MSLFHKYPTPKWMWPSLTYPSLPRVQLNFKNLGLWKTEVTLSWWSFLILPLVKKQKPFPHYHVAKLHLGSHLLPGSLLHGTFLLIHGFFLLVSQDDILQPVCHFSENLLSCAEEQQWKHTSWWYSMLPVKHPVLSSTSYRQLWMGLWFLESRHFGMLFRNRGNCSLLNFSIKA